MVMTVGEIVDLPVLQDGAPEVVTGTESLSRPVRWVHVSELEELSALLRGGELILTTGLGLPADPAAQQRYIEHLHRAEARGVILELGHRFNSAPPGLLRAGHLLGFPVVLLHHPTPFVAVTEAVHSRIVNDQVQKLRFSQQVHETFSTLSVEEPDIGEVLHRTGALAGGPVVLEDLAHRVLDYHRGNNPAGTLLRDWDRRSREAADHGISTPFGNERWLVAPVGPSRHRWGRLILPGPSSLDDDGATMLLERAAQALALAKLLEHDRRSVEHRAHAGLLAELSRGKPRNGPELTARAEALGLAPGRRYLALTLAPVNPDSAAADEPDTDPHAPERTDARVADLLALAARSAGLTALAAGLSPGTASAVLSLPDEHPDQHLERLAPDVERRIAADPDLRHNWVLGASRDSPDLPATGPLLDESAHVARIAAALPAHAQHRPYYRSADVRLRGLLSLLRDDPRATTFARSELAPLLEHDEQRGTDLLGLLQNYLQHGGNKTRLARDAHLSRPALYNRLSTIEDVLGVDLDDAESQVSLHVAVLIRQVRAEIGEP